MGFPIDEGVLGFQKYYDAAAVSPAYKIFRLKREVNVEYLDLILRSNSLRKIYKSKMQGSVERRRSIPDEMFLNIEIPNPPEEVKDQIVKQHKLIKEIENSLKENQKIASKDRSIMGTSSKLQLIPLRTHHPVWVFFCLLKHKN